MVKDNNLKDLSNVYIAGMKYDFEWSKQQIEEIINMINNGVCVQHISKSFKTKPISIFILVCSLVDEGYIDFKLTASFYGM